MDQKTIRKTSTLTGIIYLVLAILLIPLSISVLIAAKGIILLGALVVLITGISCLIAFIRNISFKKEMTRVEHLHMHDSGTQNSQNLSWLVNPEAWNRFLKEETKRRSTGLIVETALIIIVGSGLLMLSRPVGFYMSLLFTIPLAVIYYCIKYRTLLSALPKKGITVQVLVTPVSVSFNQTIYPLNSSRFRVVKAELKHQLEEYWLLINYQWPLRRGGVGEEEIRVPVPADAVAKAEAAIQLLIHQHTH